MHFEPADLVFVQGSNWISQLILRAEQSKGEEPSIASHVGGIVNNVTGMMVEALGNGVKLRNIRHYQESGIKITIYRAKNIPIWVKREIAAEARKSVGKYYGWSKIICHTLDRFVFGGRVFARLLCNFQLSEICSEVWSRAYRKYNYDFGMLDCAVQPDDMLDYCMKHDDKYECVFRLGLLDD